MIINTKHEYVNVPEVGKWYRHGIAIMLVYKVQVEKMADGLEGTFVYSFLPRDCTFFYFGIRPGENDKFYPVELESQIIDEIYESLQRKIGILQERAELRLEILSLMKYEIEKT